MRLRSSALGTGADRRARGGPWRRIVVTLVLAILVVPTLYVTAIPDKPVVVAVPAPPSGTYRVYVADWGYHTSIILQQPPDWRLGALGMESAPYVEYAWGDRRFYMESNYRPDVVFATLFLPTESVVYVESWRADPARIARPRALYARDVDASQLLALVEALEGSMRRSAAGERLEPYGAVSGYVGRFYPAHGAYLWSNDCNRWTVGRLAAARLAHGGFGVIFSGQVAGHLLGFRSADPSSLRFSG